MSGEWEERTKNLSGGSGVLEGMEDRGVCEKVFASYLAMGSHHGVAGVVWGGLCVGGLLRAGWSL